MTRLDQIKKMNWYWQNKPISLLDLHPKQLNVVERTLNTSSNKNWFNVSTDAWKNAIKDIRNAENIINKFPKLEQAIKSSL